MWLLGSVASSEGQRVGATLLLLISGVWAHPDPTLVPGRHPTASQFPTTPPAPQEQGEVAWRCSCHPIIWEAAAGEVQSQPPATQNDGHSRYISEEKQMIQTHKSPGNRITHNRRHYVCEIFTQMTQAEQRTGASSASFLPPCKQTLAACGQVHCAPASSASVLFGQDALCQ